MMGKADISELVNPGDYMTTGQVNLVIRAKNGKLYSTVLMFDTTSVTEDDIEGDPGPHLTL